MRRAALAVAFCVAATVAPILAHAGLFRTYLSARGVPGNDCSLAHPCRYLPDALAAVQPGGEVWILDSANYNQGHVDIVKSVSILAIPGQVGSISAIAGEEAIRIATPGIDVTLRNVAIMNNAVSPGGLGIRISSASSVTLEDSVIANTVGASIYVVGAVHVRLKHVVIRNSQDIAINARDGAVIDILRCELVGNRYGGVLAQSSGSGATTLVHVSDSVISGKDTTSVQGINIYTATAADVAKAYVTRSTIFQTQAALKVQGGGTSVIEVSDSVLVRNAPNLSQSGTGVLRDFGNNHIADGETADVGTLSHALLR